MEYIIVEGLNRSKLIKEVNKMIQQGWELQGGIDVAVSSGCTGYFQAMTKEENNPRDLLKKHSICISCGNKIDYDFMDGKCINCIKT